jgi:Domain of unknown function (DUF4403)
MRPLASIYAALALAAACTPHPGAGPGSDGPGEHGECSVRIPSRPYSPASTAPLPAIESHITVALRAEVAALEREIGKQVPVTLAAESGRDIGAPGQVSYVVRRGRIALGLAGDRLSVTVPVQIDVEVCKPLGPFCPIYGRCKPSLSAVASVPLLLGDDYQVGKSRVGMAMGRSCVIAGIDAGSTIREQAARQVGAIQARIDRSMPDIRPTLAGVWELLHHPVSLGTTTCLRIKPDKLAQARPSLTSGVLAAEISASGAIDVEEPCADPNAPVHAAPLPRLATLDRLPDGVDLEVPVKMEWKAVSAALTRSLASDASSQEPLRIVKVDAMGDALRVALGLTLAGRACGDVWLTGEPWYDAGTTRIRLRKVALAAGQPSLDAASELVARVERAAAIPLPVDVSSGPSALDGLVRSFSKDLTGGVRMEAKMAPARIDRVLPTADGLVAVATLAGSATLRVE